MAEAVVSGVVTRIGDLLVQEGKFLSGVSNQVELLQIELKLMQGLLKDADARENESELLRQWVAEIRDLAYDADDIIATHAHTVGSRKGGGVQKVLKRCSCILDEGITVHQVGSKIEDIMTKISNLKTSFQGYGIRESMIKGGGSSSFNERQREQRQTFSHLEHDVVGFDDDLNKLVEFLLKEGEDSRVASICDQRDEIQKLKDAEIVEKLRQVQCEKKCLVILDDIWNIEAWNSLQEPFLVRGTGSKILLTSRNKQLCLHVDPRSFLCELQCLNEERSWELLDKIAISWREDRVTKPYMEKFGKEMIGYCGGLPLAITVLGGLLAAKQTQEEWEDVLRHIKSYLHPKTIQIPTWFKLNRLRVLKVSNDKQAQDAIQMLISRCPLIEKLHLYKHLKKLPEAHQFSPNLAKLTLSGTKLEEDPVETLEKLPNLKILCFRHELEKESPDSNQLVGRASFNGKNMVCSERGFPLLQSLLLSHLYYLEEWRVEQGAMPSLCHLEIEFCGGLKMIPDGLRFITTLQELKIKNMTKSFTDRLHEGGPDFDKVKHVPSLVFQKCDY
nr:putative disease resistance protein [Quercus suber]